MTFPRLVCSLLLWASSEALTHHPLGSFSLHGLFVIAGSASSIRCGKFASLSLAQRSP